MCQAVAGRVERIGGTGLDKRGIVAVAGVERDVSLALVPEAAVGEWVIFHSGYALRKISDAEADALAGLVGGLE
jgi:hydrogenase expression/formation protein HypC